MIRIGGMLIGVWLFATGVVHGQEPADTSLGEARIGEACAEESYRQFDFWIGRWTVRDSTGTQVGTSRITRVADGCAIREEWQGASGTPGVSLNYYSPEQDEWRQDWVGGDGIILHLTGRLEGDEMVLTGERPTGDGSVLDRIRWRALPDGRVRQEWQSSTDGGQHWERVFLGFYEPRRAGATKQ